jgi:hypothetical protein
MSPLQIVSLPVHFGRTRRSVLAVIAGLGIALAVLVVGMLGAAAVLAFPDLPFPSDPDGELAASTLAELAIFAAGWALLARVSRAPREP